jgi:hypothetical protein
VNDRGAAPAPKSTTDGVTSEANHVRDPSSVTPMDQASAATIDQIGDEAFNRVGREQDE